MDTRTDPDRLAEMTAIVAAWRGFAVHAGDIVQGRSHDWRALSHLRAKVVPLPDLGVGRPSPCRELIRVTEAMATAGNFNVHFQDIWRLRREVLKRCELTETGIDLLKGMLIATGSVS